MQAEHLLHLAILAIEEGDKSRAVGLLRRLLEQQPRNAEAWYWLSKTQDDPARQRECLVRALRFQPDHTRARADFATLQSRSSPWSTPISSPQRMPSAIPSAARPQPALRQVSQPPARGKAQTGLWIALMGLLLIGVVCLSALLATASIWQPVWDQWVGELGLPVLFLTQSERLPSGLSTGYWMFEVERPIPPGNYIGDLVLLPNGVFWFGYLRGQYRLEDQQTLSLCVDSKDEGTPSTCFRVQVVSSQANQVILNLQLNTLQGEQWVEGLIYRKVLGDTHQADLAADLVGRWQPFPLDHHTRIAQGRGSEGSPDEVYLFTASGELWAGGRKLSSYRVEGDTVRVPDYFGDFGERFQVDRLGDWMVLVGQFNKPAIILSLRRVP